MVLAMYAERIIFLKIVNIVIKAFLFLTIIVIATLILFTDNDLSNILPFNEYYLFSIAIIFVIIFLLCYKLLIWLKSIQNITAKIDTILNEDFIPISTNHNNEFSEIAKKINRIAKKIQINNNDFKNVSNVRSQFIANATHEFKTPLFSIKGYVETLINGAINDKEVNKKFLNKIYSKSQELEILFNNLIEISKIESKEVTMNFDKILLNDIMVFLSENFTEYAKSKDINLFIPDTKQIYVYGNIKLLKTCFSNLLDNAIKYSTKGTVSISVKNINNSIVIKVIDNGIGISKENQKHIFERFFRVEDSRSRNLGGSGLGLSIVKHILEAHKTEIFVESDLGKGSIFSFNLNMFSNQS